ncbi:MULTISPECIES: hypothetical protein [Xanthomonas]|uniref:hypothetical protein n=1 Tax=Xanthomonas TaxID=338 RepID=UPI001ADC8508|nr:hypothetical protein [Xanthomonas phaseoli]MBO9766504.1 hypothetical protein [Xanthomonas phaseoli pv. dieffenbachiae]MBO9776151.1 hypothetical protein [Xanthomonas phaseoli pv. dieffenbachiae]MBO9778250.1 hypothetical protein [Xanthomonas phaseoli pv. dieffenbachiae]MBO9795361.1 hypothetical protein [Xanthomonas phaseoli pv. dieffenbachiae]MBO9801444.1 hypothetical protein [Xanthomonas phaseoli pv. dieffenbachiae]
MNRHAIAIIATLLWSVAMFGAGWAWRGDRAEGAISEQKAGAALGALAGEQAARATEHQQAGAAQQAGDKATAREDKIDADYDARIAAAVAGRDSELSRVRRLWAGCETDRLSGGATAAAEAAEQDRLRGASAARVVRACELAQSERDEAIDRYQALRP